MQLSLEFVLIGLSREEFEEEVTRYGAWDEHPKTTNWTEYSISKTDLEKAFRTEALAHVQQQKKDIEKRMKAQSLDAVDTAVAAITSELSKVSNALTSQTENFNK